LYSFTSETDYEILPAMHTVYFGFDHYCLRKETDVDHLYSIVIVLVILVAM